MTMTARIKIMLAGALVLILALGWLRIKSLESDNLDLYQAAALAGAEAAGLRRELAEGQAALTVREAEKTRLAAQTEALRHELEELYNNDEPCQTWADSLMPDPVYRRLRP